VAPVFLLSSTKGSVSHTGPFLRGSTTLHCQDKAAARKRFEAVYTVVRDDLLADFRKHNMPEESIEYYRRVRIHTHMYGFSYALVLTARDRAWTTTSQVENSTAV